MKVRSWLLVGGVVVALCACAKQTEVPAPAPAEAASSEASVDEGGLIPGQMDVYFDDEMIALIEEDLLSGSVQTKSEALNDFFQDLGVTALRRIFPVDPEWEDRHREFGLHKWYRITFDEHRPQTRAVDAACELPGVVNATPVYRIATDEVVFNDPMAGRQWHYDNNAVSWADVNVVPVWKNYTVGSSNVIVSVVDGGIDLNHEDLSANCLPGGSDGSKNFMYDNTGYRIVAHDHGTHVAGTIAAVNNNGKGVAGLAGGDAAKGIAGVKLMSCQIFQDGLSGGANDEAAIIWGADHGAVLSNNSWGYHHYDAKGNYLADQAKSSHDFYVRPNEGSYKASFKDAVDYFSKYAGTDKKGHQTGPMAGGLVIFAAGNDGRPYGAPGCYPGCLNVGAINASGQRSTFSNYGDWVDICAPGVNVLSTTPDNSYSVMDGTSMACPHVTGVAALVVSYCGGEGFTRDQLWDKLVEGANGADIPSSYRIGPLVDALGAITYGSGEPPAPVSSFTVDKVNSNNVTISLKVTGDAEGKPAYGFRVLASTSKATLEKCDPRSPGEGVLHGSFLSREAAIGETVTGTVGDLGFNTKYYIAVSAFDYGRNFSAISPIQEITTGGNHAPTITTSYDGNYQFHVHDRFQIPFTIVDADDHVVTVLFEKDPDDPGVLTLLESTVPGEYNIQVLGNMAPAGTYHAVLTASDNYGLSVTRNITYVVLPNAAPVVLKPFENILMHAAGESIKLDTKDYIEDPDGEILSFSIDISDRSVVNVNQAAASTVLTVTSIAKAGMATVTLSAEDAGGLPVQSSFQVLVRPSDVEMQCYPNPVVNTLWVATGEQSESATISIYSASGALVYQNVATCSAFDPAQVNMKSAAPGYYKVCVSFGGKTYTSNIVKK